MSKVLRHPCVRRLFHSESQSAVFRKFVPKATAQFLNDQLNDRLTTALVGASFTPDVPDAPIDPLDSGAVALAEQREASIIATPDELEGYGIVKAFVCSAVKPARITARDQQSYFAILLDEPQDDRATPSTRSQTRSQRHSN